MPMPSSRTQNVASPRRPCSDRDGRGRDEYFSALSTRLTSTSWTRRRSAVTGGVVGELADDALPVSWKSAITSSTRSANRNMNTALRVVVLEVRLAERVRDQPEQPTGLALDRRESLGRDGIARQRRLAKDVDVPSDAGERRPELVRRRGDEVALHPVELAELGDGVLLALQEIGELIGLLLELVVLSAQRPGDPDHQREHHDVEREQADAERDREVRVSRSISAWITE